MSSRSEPHLPPSARFRSTTPASVTAPKEVAALTLKLARRRVGIAGETSEKKPCVKRTLARPARLVDGQATMAILAPTFAQLERQDARRSNEDPLARTHSRPARGLRQ